MHSLRERVRETRWRRRLAARRTLDHALPRSPSASSAASIVAFGIVTIPLPGPGWLTVIAGLFVLATEFTWAERLLEFTRRHVKRWTDWVGRQPVWVRVLIAAGDGGVRLRRARGDPARHRGAALGAGVGAALALSVWHTRDGSGRLAQW